MAQTEERQKALLISAFETLQHEARLWKTIAKRNDASEYIREIAGIRAEALQAEVDKIYKALTE